MAVPGQNPGKSGRKLMTLRTFPHPPGKFPGSSRGFLMARYTLLGRRCCACPAGLSHFIVTAAAIAVKGLLVIQHYRFGGAFNRYLGNFR
jgi:hypothetical protein